MMFTVWKSKISKLTELSLNSEIRWSDVYVRSQNTIGDLQPLAIMTKLITSLDDVITYRTLYSVTREK